MALIRCKYASKSSLIFYLFCLASFSFGWILFELLFHVFVGDDFLIRRYGETDGELSTGEQIANKHKEVEERLALDLNNGKIFRKNYSSCNFWTCSNPYQCGFARRKLSVFVYPSFKSYVEPSGTSHDSSVSKEYAEIIRTIKSSEFYELDSAKSCLLVPSVDTLNVNATSFNITGRVLWSLPSWNGGENHLIFNVQRDIAFSDLNIGNTIVATGGGVRNRRNYRPTFDVSIPVLNSFASRSLSKHLDKNYKQRPFLLLILIVSNVVNKRLKLLQETVRNLAVDHPNLVLLLYECKSKAWSKKCDSEGNVHDYPQVLQTSQYCLVLEDSYVGQIHFSDALMSGCVPVIFDDSFLLPFFEVIDWKRAALLLFSHQASVLTSVLSNDVSTQRAFSMQLQGQKLWLEYFSSISSIVLTTLRILDERFFPENVRTYEEWNLIDSSVLYQPLYLSRVAPDYGFTTVILCHSRVSTMFKIIEKLGEIRSLAKIIVVWNNPDQPPPERSEFPITSKPIKLYRMTSNLLTNRFLPFEDIDSEAVFSLDDDITMLNRDEIEFAYQVWREYPSQLVGFPSRVHNVNLVTGQLSYISEWTNNISMILTGAAFYHKYYNYLFTTKLPKRLKTYVDETKNCEDILMNFLIANVTRQPALKVTPRKKFRLTDTIGRDLSTDSGHLKQRSLCLNRFRQEFGNLTLSAVEFRVDPVLYKIDDVPADVLQYKDIGSL